MNLKPRFETVNKMFLAGLRRHHSFTDGVSNIAAQWQEFVKGLPLENQIGSKTYGVMCGHDPKAKTFEYMTAVEVSEFTPNLEWNQRLIIPIARYAVFTHQCETHELHISWQQIWDEWLPNSGYASSNIPDFELYDERFDPDTGHGIIELWVPIRPKSTIKP